MLANPFEQMQLMQSAYTTTDKHIHDKVLGNIDTVLRMGAVDLAEEFKVSQPSLTRFCKKLGYRGFAEFKSAMYQYQKLAAITEAPDTTIDSYCQLLQRIPAALENADVEGFAKELCGARTVATTGFHKSALPAQLLHLNLLKFAIPSQFSPFDQLDACIQGLFTNEDSLVIFSATGKTFRDAIEAILEADADHQPRVTLVTMNAKTSLRNKVDRVIWLPNYQNQKMDHYLETQVTFMVFADLLTGEIAKSASH